MRPHNLIFDSEDDTCQHSFYMSIAIGSVATTATTYILIMADFATNIFNSFKIINMNRKTFTEKNYTSGKLKKETEEMVWMLVLTEIMEIVVPFAYAISFAVAYYGPNSKILGNIGNSYWQFNAVKDIGKTVEFISMFFFIDFCSVILCTFLLWRFCKINLLRPFVALQKEFGMVFLLNLCYKLNGVSDSNVSLQ